MGKIILAAFLILLAIYLGSAIYGAGDIDELSSGLLLSLIIVTSIVFLFSASLLLVSVASAVKQGTTAKNIVVCLDGTWNEPGTTDFGYLAETNVFKLFNLLKGNPPASTTMPIDARSTWTTSSFPNRSPSITTAWATSLKNSELGQLFGGAFGLGAEAIVQRAYLDVWCACIGLAIGYSSSVLAEVLLLPGFWLGPSTGAALPRACGRCAYLGDIGQFGCRPKG